LLKNGGENCIHQKDQFKVGGNILFGLKIALQSIFSKLKKEE